MNDSITDTPTRRSPLMIGGVGVGGVLLLLLLIPTCRGPSSNPGGVGGAALSRGGVPREQCERMLGSALDGLRPNRLGLSSEGRVMVDTLNNWMSQCASTEAAEDDADKQLRQQLLAEEAFEITNQDRFQEWDAAHIRNALLAKAIVDTVVGEERTDRDRAVELFYFVVRTVELLPDGVIDLPQTPYETLLFGQGTAADRAWVFALLLRQLRLDCVMLQPRIPEGDPPYWILGVVTPGEGVHLFDARLGLPITAGDDGSTPLPRLPATLADIREDDSVLRQFDRGDVTYPLTADVLRTVDVFAIGTSSTWSPRMGRLQAELGEPVELHDGLASSRLRETGLFERLVAAGSGGLWTPEQVRLWPYPESRWGDAQRLNAQQQQLMAARFSVLEGPFDITGQQNEQGDVVPVVNKPQRSLRQARIEQLLGNYAAAQQVYILSRLKIQDFQQLNLPEVQINYLAADLATHWGSQCQYEQKDYQAAAESELRYLQRPDGQFRLSALSLASVSLAQEGQLAEAAELLSQEPPQAPQHLGNQRLVERWRRQFTASEKPTSTTQPDPSAADEEGNDKSANANPAASSGTDTNEK